MFEIIEIRAKVGKDNGVEFIVHTNEQNHNLSHVHAKYGKHEISVAIESFKVLAGNLPPKQTRIAQEWVENNQAKLRNDWKTYASSATSAYTMSGLD